MRRLIEAWASFKSFKAKQDRRDGGPGDGNNWPDFRSEQRRYDPHEPTTDPETKLVRKDGREAKLAFAGHPAMENRHGLRVLFEVKPAVGSDAEVAVQQIAELQQRGISSARPRRPAASAKAATLASNACLPRHGMLSPRVISCAWRAFRWGDREPRGVMPPVLRCRRTPRKTTACLALINKFGRHKTRNRRKTV